jgi:hypothetical protein
MFHEKNAFDGRAGYCLYTRVCPAAGRTISGNDKVVQEGAYVGDKAVESAFFVVKAANLDEATEIPKKCPIYELGGSVEIREVMNMAN